MTRKLSCDFRTCRCQPIFTTPFAPESFDFIYSIGVLHHTPNCEQAFKALPSLLKPGGTIAIWLYSGYHNWYRFSDVYRKVTHRLPARWLHRLCHMGTPLYWLDRGLRGIPLVGRPLSELVRHVFPVSRNPNREVRILDTFDWYSPKYQSKHTYEQVFRWFESCGLDSVRVLHTPIAVRGRRPQTTGDAPLTRPATSSTVSPKAQGSRSGQRCDT